MESSMNEPTDAYEPEVGPSPTGLEPPPPGQPEGAAFSTTIRPHRLWRIGVVAASGLVLLISAALAFGASPAPSPGSSQTPSSDGGRLGNDGWLPAAGLLDPAGPLALSPGKGVDREFRLGRFGGVTITAINGSNLSLKTDDGWTRTIAVTSSTKITKGDRTITLSDLKVGDSIGFSQRRNDDGTYTIDAIAVLIPRVAGTVSDVTSSGFTLKARDGTTWTITVTGSTTYTIGSASGSKADVKAGTNVVVSGEKGSTDTSLTAQSVQVRVPVVFGQVTAKSGSTITIRRLDGTTQTLHVGSGTTYRVRGKDAASLSDITVGMNIVAQGAQRPDGSLDATVVAAGVNRGFKEFGPGFGFPPGFNRNGQNPNGQDATPSASADGSATQS
jgi:Domain of unknown function (DUF5666)